VCYRFAGHTPEPLRIFLALLILLASTGVEAFLNLPTTITGRLTDEATGQPLSPVYFVAEETLRAPAPIHGSVHICL
jgi:hypothetical protein